MTQYGRVQGVGGILEFCTGAGMHDKSGGLYTISNHWVYLISAKQSKARGGICLDALSIEPLPRIGGCRGLSISAVWA